MADAWRAEIARWKAAKHPLFEEWDERSAILTHDAGLPRDAAEKAAYDMIKAQLEAAKETKR